MRQSALAFLVAIVVLVPASALAAPRIKDITDLEGARPNQLYGFGLVTGLEGTGGTSPFTQRVAVDMLNKLQVGSTTFQQNQSDNVFRSRSIAAVMVTAELGPFTRKGGRIDVTVSVLDDSSSLQGGVLLLTPLRGADGVVYATAQGPLVVGGFSFKGQGATVQKNFVNVARIPGGAFVEHEARGDVLCNGRIRLLLRNPDHNTAVQIAHKVNGKLPGSAHALDAGTVQVNVPPSLWAHVVTLVGEIGNLHVEPDVAARVVINERTGTVIAGENVTLSTVAISHGNLAIVTQERPEVSQPLPFSKGKTAVVPRTDLGATETGTTLNVVKRPLTVGELAQGLNALGVTPRDLISIFQALKQAGALHAELIIE